MDTGMQPTSTELHYWIAPAVLVDRLNQANDHKWLAQEAATYAKTFTGSGSDARPTRLSP